MPRQRSLLEIVRDELARLAATPPDQDAFRDLYAKVIDESEWDKPEEESYVLTLESGFQQSPSPRVRLGYLNFYALMQNHVGRNVIEEFLTDPDETVRERAWSYWRHGYSAARYNAATVLDAMDAETPDAAMSVLRDPVYNDSAVRNALGIVAAHKTLEAIPLIEDILRSPFREGETKVAAVWTLEMMEDALSAMGILLAAHSRWSLVVIAACEAILRLDIKEFIPALERHLDEAGETLPEDVRAELKDTVMRLKVRG